MVKLHQKISETGADMFDAAHNGHILFSPQGLVSAAE